MYQQNSKWEISKFKIPLTSCTNFKSNFVGVPKQKKALLECVYRVALPLNKVCVYLIKMYTKYLCTKQASLHKGLKSEFNVYKNLHLIDKTSISSGKICFNLHGIGTNGPLRLKVFSTPLWVTGYYVQAH